MTITSPNPSPEIPHPNLDGTPVFPLVKDQPTLLARGYLDRGTKANHRRQIIGSAVEQGSI